MPIKFFVACHPWRPLFESPLRGAKNGSWPFFAMFGGRSRQFGDAPDAVAEGATLPPLREMKEVLER